MPLASDLRQRAPSKRSLATRERILDAAETVFADKGFDGATMRDIALAAGQPLGLVHHHGGGKEGLFHQTVARRAETLSRARLKALADLREADALTLESVLAAFLRPFFALAQAEPGWHAYARLIALASTDTRWRAVTEQCFDPTAAIFLNEIMTLVPDLSQPEAAEGFVFVVSAMLALLTSQPRIAALGGEAAGEDAQLDHLIRFAAAGFSRRAP